MRQIACAVVSGHREMERESGFQGIPGESRVKGPVLREPNSQPDFAQTQLPKGQPGVLPRAGAPKKAWRGRWLKSLKRCTLRGRRGAKIKKSLKAKRALI